MVVFSWSPCWLESRGQKPHCPAKMLGPVNACRVLPAFARTIESHCAQIVSIGAPS